MSLADIDRPLNKRGERNAPEMAIKCKERGYIPEQMITSNANRAKTTAVVFKNEFQVSDENFSKEPDLYHAPEDTYLEVCFGLDEEINSVMLFGHNPGITYLANSVANTYIDNVPTCGVLVIDAKIDRWEDLSFTDCTLIDFIYPKMF